MDDDSVICTPRKGAWGGGDEILMVIPKLDRRKSKVKEFNMNTNRWRRNILVFSIYFDYGAMGKSSDFKVLLVDSRTIFFRTPACPLLAVSQNLIVPIVVIQNDVVIAKVDYIYLARKHSSTNRMKKKKQFFFFLSLGF